VGHLRVSTATVGVTGLTCTPHSTVLHFTGTCDLAVGSLLPRNVKSFLSNLRRSGMIKWSSHLINNRRYGNKKVSLADQPGLCISRNGLALDTSHLVFRKRIFGHDYSHPWTSLGNTRVCIGD
jgi:hypothetical protein